MNDDDTQAPEDCECAGLYPEEVAECCLCGRTADEHGAQLQGVGLITVTGEGKLTAEAIMR